MFTAAIIPARAGSRGIKDKNLQPVGGIPLLARAVRAARAASNVDLVVVSSDGRELLDLAEAEGARAIERPSELAGDQASSEAALLHALRALEADGTSAEVVAFVQCTSPFVRSEDIEATVACVHDGSADSAFSATPWHGFVWQQSPHGWTGANHDPTRRVRRQDRPVEVLETGSVYAFTTEGFLEAKHRFFGTVRPVFIPTDRALEVDDPEDLEEARALAAVLDPVPDIRTAQAIVLDFDGVFTDNRVLTLSDGTEGILAHRGDGFGISSILSQTSLKMVVLSTEVDDVVAARCKKLGLQVRQGLGADKVSALQTWTREEEVDLDRTIFVGNDVNDLECMAIVGFPMCPEDAVHEVRAVAHHVLRHPGGFGAVRELCDLILEQHRREES